MTSAPQHERHWTANELCVAPIDDSPLPPHVVLGRVERSQVEYACVDGQVVAWSAADRSLHLLDPWTSLVFELADGATSLRQTVDEICSETAEERSTVEHFVGAAASTLANLQLIRIADGDP